MHYPVRPASAKGPLAGGNTSLTRMLRFMGFNVRRRLLEAEDGLRYSRHVRRIMCHYKLRRARGHGIGAVASLCAAARLADDPGLEQEIQSRIVRAVGELDLSGLDWSDFIPQFEHRHIYKAAILKPYVSPSERGVVYVSFEAQWAKLLNQENVAAFAERYRLVCAPSSSPHNVINYVFPRAYPDSYFTGISNPEDQATIPRIASTIRVLPIYASQWVNPDLFQPKPHAHREFDLVMVASWGKVKRHQALFSAMRAMPRDTRVLLVGQDQEGRTAETIRALAASYGVAGQVTIAANQPYPAVARHLANARASVVLSRREGSCVVVAESLFADTPAALLHGAVIGSRTFLNDQTGCFLDPRQLGRDLARFIEASGSFRARAWAERNIASNRTTALLNDMLRQEARARGEDWTLDLAPLQWSPDPVLAAPADRARLVPEQKDVASRFGLLIGPELSPA